ncbi:MAG: GntR family transcriptional regulator [Armatimonadota bacterium]
MHNARRSLPPTSVSELARRFADGVPLYLQIAESLLSQIESGELKPGERLSPERTLSETLGVNRMTLRQALSKLETEGYLDRRQGSGTFVAQPKIERQAGRLVPFTRAMARRGFKPGAKVVALEKQPASVTIAGKLRLPVSASVYFVRRVRLINREPVMLETFWMPVRRFPRFERFDIIARSVYEILETEYGVTVSRARQSLEPAVASEYEAQLLGIETGAPLMLEERLAFDRRGRPIDYGKDLYRGDRFRFVTESAPLER